LRLYSYHTSFVSFANGYLRVMVHIPALRTGGMLSLVQFLPMPWMVQSGPKKEMGTYVMPSPGDSVLAIDDSKTVYKTMSLAALHDCTQTLGFFKCPQMSLADRRTQDSCLVGLYAADHEVVQRHCPLSLSPPADMLVQLNNSDFILFQPQSAYVEMRCPGKVSSEKVKGLWRIRVESGCVATTPSYRFEGALNVFGSPFEVQMRVLELTDLLDEDMMSAITTMTADDLESLRLVGKAEGMTIRDLKKEFANQKFQMVYHFGLGSLLIVLIVFVTCLCCLRYRHLRKRMHGKDRSWWQLPMFMPTNPLPSAPTNDHSVEMGPLLQASATLHESRVRAVVDRVMAQLKKEEKETLPLRQPH
jgi:hypothetical protein